MAQLRELKKIREARRLVEILIDIGFFNVHTTNVTPIGQIRLSKLYDYLSMSDIEKENVIQKFSEAIAIFKAEELDEGVKNEF